MTLEHEIRDTRKTRTTLAIACVAASLPLAACTVPNDAPPSLAVHLTHESVAASTPITISGDNLAFLADEATSGPAGTDFNHDGDTLDTVPVVVNLSLASENVIPVQANSLSWLGSDLFLVVDEAKDGRDWSGNGNTTDLVILHWSAAAPQPVFIDIVEPDPNPSAPTPRTITTAQALFYVSGGSVPTGAHTSTINVITSASPLTHTQVMTDDPTATLSPSLLASDEGLIFLGLNEVTEARDLNSDTDMVDQYVLALLDGTSSTSIIHNTGLAMSNGTGPFRAAGTGVAGDWQVGFLVSEAAQGATNFNNYTVAAANLTASWQPTQCIGHEDNDTLDNVLFYIFYANWVADPVTNPPRNTGLVGSQKIAIANGFVATISIEADEGTCDLNSNLETTDNVVRVTQMVPGALTPVLPLTNALQIRALFDVPGGTHGLSELVQGSTRVFTIVVDQTLDNPAVNWGGQIGFHLFGWMLPTNNNSLWDFTHSTSNSALVGVSWLGQQPDHSIADTALTENVGGISLNAGGDSDTADSVPTFGSFNGSNVVFPGVSVATQQANAGIVALSSFGFFRVDEAADNRDWDGDGDKADIVLMRVSFTQSTTAVMGTLVPNLTGPVIPVQFGIPENGGAFVFNEASYGTIGTDVNGDGTIHPFVAYFHF